MDTLPEIGDHVLIPFHPAPKEVEVIEVYTTGIEPMVTVEVCWEDSDEPTTMAWPVSRLISPIDAS
ncbi:hypothetical protein WEI85_01450 [Actinomycetes bacterium KLBMP 9797]